MTTQIPPPPPTVDMAGPLIKAGVIMAAGQLGLFTLLASGPRSVSDIAGVLDTSESAMKLLAEALASIGYLEREDDRYANGPYHAPGSPLGAPLTSRHYFSLLHSVGT